MKLAPSTIRPSSRASETPGAVAKPMVRLRADSRRGAVRISGKPLADAARLPTRRELIDRFFSITTLRALRLDPSTGTAWLSFDSSEVTVAEALDALAANLRAPIPPRLSLPHEELLLSDWAEQPFEVWRADRGLTLWNLEELDPGRFRLSHPLLRRRILREKALDALAALAGVIGHSISIFRPASIEVHCQPHRINSGILIEAMESALADHATVPALELLPIRESIVTANLVLAPISDFLFPPLGIVNAVLVWALNAEHVAPAIQGLRQRRANLELLYLCVGALTLLTFSFFAAALMYAMLELWPKLVRQLRIAGERQFLARYRRRPQRVWVERDGALLERGLAELPSGEIMVLREGDIVPGDGVVLDGSGEVNESWITGATGTIPKLAGDLIFASTELCQGEIRIRMDVTGESTAAARLASWYGQSLRQPSVKAKAEHFADSMVLPALIFGAAALGRGGISMAKAVLRPDYYTGPAIAEELSDLLTIIQAAEAGFYISNQEVLDRLTESDCWIFDDSVPWKSHAHGSSLGFAGKMRSRGVGEVLFLSSQSGSDTARLAHELGFDVHQSRFSTEAKKALIAQRQSLGQTIAYFGDCGAQAAAAEQANVSVSVLDRRQLATPGAPVALLVPDLARCSLLYSLSQARTTSASSAFLSSVVPNVVAAAGAIYLNFGVLNSVILTNLGTLASYYRWRRTLQSAQ